ncbi:MAG: MFS transporter [bacterium]|nr:MFS transporter [bacterium]
MNKRTDGKGNWLWLAMLFGGGHFITDMYGAFTAPMLPLLMKKLNFTVAFAGFIAAVISFASSFIQVLFGYLSDKISRRIFVIAGPAIAAIFFSSIGLMTDKWMLVICLMMGGVGIAQFHPLAAKMVHELSKTHKGKAMSVFVTGGSIGYSIGPLVVTSIIALWGLDYLPLAVIPGIIISVLLYLYAPRHIAVNSSTRVFIKKENLKQVKSLMLYVCIGISRSVVIMSFTTLVPILYSIRELPLEKGGFAVFILHFFGGLGVFIGGFIADKVSPRLLITLSFLFGAPALFAFIISSEPFALFFLAVAGFLLYSSIPAVITQAQATMPSHMSTVSSMVMGFSWGVGGLLVMAVGKFADVFGVFETLRVLSLFPLTGFFLSLLLHIRSGPETKLPEYI